MDVTNLREVSVPFVTSQRADFLNQHVLAHAFGKMEQSKELKGALFSFLERALTAQRHILLLENID